MTSATRLRGRTPHSTALNSPRRTRELLALGDDPNVDVVIIGGGVTGAGLALDAASRGLRTVLVEAHDLAFGTSRWSSKLVHGGLRYLATGQVGIAYESAYERNLLMTRIAPHLTRPMSQVIPLHSPGIVARGGLAGVGYGMGDVLRRVAGTPGSVLRSPRPIGKDDVIRLAPAVRHAELQGGIRGFDGQLIDDARLVVAIARTAAGYGASVLTRARAIHATGDRVVVRDELSGDELVLNARAVVSAAGVWAGEVAPDVRLRPSRGTHLVIESARFGWSEVSLTAPLPGSSSRFVFSLPAQHGRTYIGLTDVPADGPLPDVPHATDAEIDMLLDVFGSVLETPLTRADVVGTFAGLRPLLTGADGEGETSDLSRKHAIVESDSGLLSVVGGKLTTYRRMAEDGMSAVASRRLGRGIGPCRTRDLPLVGAWPRTRIGEIDAAPRLVRRYGAEAPFAAALPDGPGAARGVTAQELQWGIAVEGALSVDDLLDRRTRLGLVASDREESMDAAAAAFEREAVVPA